MPRQPLPIDWEAVAEMLKRGHEGTHIAAYYGISVSTLYARCEIENNCLFSQYKAEKRALGDAALLDTLYDTAVNDKDKAVMIFMAKNRLGMRDKPLDGEVVKDTISITFKRDESIEE
jgi:hypothetical protein